MSEMLQGAVAFIALIGFVYFWALAHASRGKLRELKGELKRAERYERQTQERADSTRQGYINVLRENERLEGLLKQARREVEALKGERDAAIDRARTSPEVEVLEVLRGDLDAIDARVRKALGLNERPNRADPLPTIELVKEVIGAWQSEMKAGQAIRAERDKWRGAAESAADELREEQEAHAGLKKLYKLDTGRLREHIAALEAVQTTDAHKTLAEIRRALVDAWEPHTYQPSEFGLAEDITALGKGMRAQRASARVALRQADEWRRQAEHAEAWAVAAMERCVGLESQLSIVRAEISRLSAMPSLPARHPFEVTFDPTPEMKAQIKAAFEGTKPSRVMLAPPDPVFDSSGLGRITAERMRQLTVEGYSPEHDDAHTDNELAWTAACYAAPDDTAFRWDRRGAIHVDAWPGICTDRRAEHARIRQLAIAGALCAAEIDRLLRDGVTTQMKVEDDLYEWDRDPFAPGHPTPSSWSEPCVDCGTRTPFPRRHANTEALCRVRCHECTHARRQGKRP